MRPSEIRPDLVLKEILEGNLVLQTSETEFADIKVYAQGERPNIGLDSEFVEIMFNGLIRSVTKPIGFVKGNLAIGIYVKTYQDGSVFGYRVQKLEELIQELVSDVTAKGFFLSFNLDSIITPTTVNTTTGYSQTILNVEWHTV